jgi:hypothetical protein
VVVSTTCRRKSIHTIRSRPLKKRSAELETMHSWKRM